MSYYILYLVRLVWFCFFFRSVATWLGFQSGGWNLLRLDESRCAQYREMLLLISCQRAKHQHMSSHHTSPFFFFSFPSAFHPTLLTQRQKSLSLVLMLSCTLEAHRSPLLSLQVSVIVCVKEPHYHLHPYYIHHDHELTHTHTRTMGGFLFTHSCRKKI